LAPTVKKVRRRGFPAQDEARESAIVAMVASSQVWTLMFRAATPNRGFAIS
jgi:hypothetical protein